MSNQNECPHGEAVKWNPYNEVVQCHRCGQVFIPENDTAFADWATKLPNVHPSKVEPTTPVKGLDKAIEAAVAKEKRIRPQLERFGLTPEQFRSVFGGMLTDCHWSCYDDNTEASAPRGYSAASWVVALSNAFKGKHPSDDAEDAVWLWAVERDTTHPIPRVTQLKSPVPVLFTFGQARGIFVKFAELSLETMGRIEKEGPRTNYDLPPGAALYTDGPTISSEDQPELVSEITGIPLEELDGTHDYDAGRLVECVDNDGAPWLTVGQMYKVGATSSTARIREGEVYLEGMEGAAAEQSYRKDRFKSHVATFEFDAEGVQERLEEHVDGAFPKMWPGTDDPIEYQAQLIESMTATGLPFRWEHPSADSRTWDQDWVTFDNALVSASEWIDPESSVPVTFGIWLDGKYVASIQLNVQDTLQMRDLLKADYEKNPDDYPHLCALTDDKQSTGMLDLPPEVKAEISGLLDKCEATLQGETVEEDTVEVQALAAEHVRMVENVRKAKELQCDGWCVRTLKNNGEPGGWADKESTREHHAWPTALDAVKRGIIMCERKQWPDSYEPMVIVGAQTNGGVPNPTLRLTLAGAREFVQLWGDVVVGVVSGACKPNANGRAYPVKVGTIGHVTAHMVARPEDMHEEDGVTVIDKAELVSVSTMLPETVDEARGKMGVDPDTVSGKFPTAEEVYSTVEAKMEKYHYARMCGLIERNRVRECVGWTVRNILEDGSWGVWLTTRYTTQLGAVRHGMGMVAWAKRNGYEHAVIAVGAVHEDGSIVELITLAEPAVDLFLRAWEALYGVDDASTVDLTGTNYVVGGVDMAAEGTESTTERTVLLPDGRVMPKGLDVVDADDTGKEKHAPLRPSWDRKDGIENADK